MKKKKMINKAIGFANDILLSLTFLITTAACTLSNEACFELGLRRADLQCTSCEKLAHFNLDEILKDNCLNCCVKVEKEPVKKYAQARLEVCAWKIGHYPQIQAFVKSDLPNSFSGFSVKYVRGADPVIKLLDTDGNVQDELSIQKWDTDTITDFLKEHLNE